MSDNVPCGFIMEVEMRNFMCHKFLRVKLENKVNIITGANGSGKSALVCAILIGLGGRASLTNRGRTVTECIQIGQRMAVVRLKIANAGALAFRPESYGEAIIVERRISNAGSKYSLKSSAGGEVSTSVNELTALLDHFNIQVQNPACILTQDNSRTFLHKLSPSLLYEFFTHSTRLMEIKYGLQEAVEKIGAALKTVKCKEMAVSDTKKTVVALEQKLRHCRMRQNAKERLELAEKELAWAKFYDADGRLQLASRSLDSLREKHASATSLHTAKADYGMQLSDKTDAIGEKIKEVKVQLENLNKNMSLKSANVDRLNSDIIRKKAINLSFNEELERTEVEMRSYEKKMSEIEQRRKPSKQQLQLWEQCEEEIKEIQEQRNIKMEAIRVAERDSVHVSTSLATLAVEERQLTKDVETIESKIRSIATQVTFLRSSGADPLTRFGAKTVALASRIHQNSAMFKRLPRGPLGAYLSVRSRQWIKAVETCLGNLMYAYLCDDFDDAARLRSMAKECGILDHSLILIITDFGNNVPYDVSKNQAVCDFPTVLSEICCDDGLVRNVLIDERSLECTILFASHEEMLEVMSNSPPKNARSAISADGSSCHVFPTFRFYIPDNRQFHLLTSSVAELIAELKNESIECEKEKKTIVAQAKTLRTKRDDLSAELKKRKDEMASMKADVVSMSRRLQELQKAVVKPAGAKFSTETLKRQLNGLQERVDVLKEELSKGNAEVQELEALLAEERGALQTERRERSKVMESLKVMSEEVRTISEEKLAVASEASELEKKLRIMKTEIGALQRNVETLKEEAREAEGFARSVCEERLAVEMGVKDLLSLIAELKCNIEQEDCEISLEELTDQWQQASSRLKAMSAEVAESNSTLKRLEGETEKRQRQYLKLQSSVTETVEASFRACISLRNVQGRLYIDHNEQTLQIQIHDDCRGGSKDGRSASCFRSLSGGERSFATICLLLALWETIDCPFRCLDEFDVFMDMVNRKAAVEMLIEFARNSAGATKQFIFLTPLQMYECMQGTDVNLIQIADVGNEELHSSRSKKSRTETDSDFSL